ncbi:hypothetical protein MNBD_ALPHA11-2204 [hydrothermal vent metagenome]|uniref:Zinc finger/thioredoxin putative domain-containing protein n=1 Tax=hydrothermal vent metagenome TaxID=652676 RepID=A0A3B0U9Q0_9ZZZZ
MAPDLIGKSGRKVRCANCQKDWRAFAEPSNDDQNQSVAGDKREIASKKFDEDEMDAAFEAVEKENQPLEALKQSGKNQHKDAKEKQSNKPSEGAKQRADMEWRKSAINRSMPRAKMRRVVRIAATVVFTLIILFVLIFRGSIVRAFPDLAGIYQSVGLGVNVVGLEFSEVETLKSLNDGGEILYINAEIGSVSSKQVNVPRVKISLLDEDGVSIFEWSITPKASIILPGEWIPLYTQLSSPPEGTRSVRLAFESTN